MTALQLGVFNIVISHVCSQSCQNANQIDQIGLLPVDYLEEARTLKPFPEMSHRVLRSVRRRKGNYLDNPVINGTTKTIKLPSGTITLLEPSSPCSPCSGPPCSHRQRTE